MKFFLSIFLLLTTAFYVLPVKEILKEKQTMCNTDWDEVKEESNKKEKIKELFSFCSTCTIANDSYSSTCQYLSFIIPVLLQTIETPPPDIF